MSRIFSTTELNEIDKRLQGDYSDKQGVFAARAKPKIIEILKDWLPIKKELEALIKPKRKKNE